MFLCCGHSKGVGGEETFFMHAQRLWCLLKMMGKIFRCAHTSWGQPAVNLGSEFRCLEPAQHGEWGIHHLPGSRTLPRNIWEKCCPVCSLWPWAEKCSPGGSGPARSPGHPVIPICPAHSPAGCPRCPFFFSSFFFFNIYVFIWLRWVLVVARGIFIAACGIFHCSVRDLSLQRVGSVVAALGLSCPVACGILVPQPGIKSASPALEGAFLTSGPPRKSPRCPSLLKHCRSLKKRKNHINHINLHCAVRR